jgi:hypothetical protein
MTVSLRSAAGRILRHRYTVRGRRLLEDGRRVAAGSAALVRCLLTRERVDLALGQFSTESTLAATGHPSRYLVLVANAGSTPRDVTLRIEIRRAGAPPMPDDFYACFSTHLKAAARASTPVALLYDWLVGAEFLAGDIPSPPDDFRRGTIAGSGRYAVSAALLDPAGAVLERLTVYQELAG